MTRRRAEHPGDSGGISRRALLTGSAAAGGAVLVGSAVVTGQGVGGRAAANGSFVPFHGAHQPGIVSEPHPAVGLMAALTLVTRDRAGLQSLFRDLSDEVEGLMTGRPPVTRDPAYPPTDSGLLGDSPSPDDLSVVVSVGASLFDERYGLSDRKPQELVVMPFLANDRLDPQRSHGDILITISASHPDTAHFALRQVMRRTRSHLVLHWTVDGYTRGAPGQSGAPRNLMGFKDGTANLRSSDEAALDRHVWVGADDGEPDWAVGGSYHVARQIRMFVEFWDRTPLAEQEAIMGRHKVSGAPLGQRAEDAVPDMAGTAIPVDAHIRLANPRTPESEANLILRRGFHYTRGFDQAGQLDQGLAFVSYQRSLAAGFLAVQERLNGEPLEEYILPEGGGFYFALPGVRQPGGYLGEGLFA